MADNYIIPLGVNSENISKGLNEAITLLDEVGDKASGTGKSIEEAFGRGAKAADTLEAGLKPVERDLASILEASETTGKSLRETFDLRKASKDFSNQVAGFKKQLKEITDRQRIGLEIDPAAVKNLKEARDVLVKNFDDIQKTLKRGSEELTKNVETSRAGVAQIKADMKDLEDAMKGIAPGVSRQDMEAELAAIRQALDEETASLEFYENQLKQVNTANKDLVDTLQKSNVALDAASENVTGLGSSFKEVYGDLKPLTTRLGELEDRMYEMSLAGQQNTQEFKELQSEAIKYRQTIQQVDAAVNTFAKRSAVLDIAVEAAQGLTGAFAAAQGAAALFGDENEEVAEALLKVNAAMSVLQGVQAVAAVLNKQSAISAALLRTGLLQQATATDAVTAATTRQTAATRVLGVAMKSLGIGLIISLIAALASNWDSVTAAINKLLPAGAKLENWFDRIYSVAVGVGTALFEYLITPFKVFSSIIEGDFKGAVDDIKNGFNIIGNFSEGYRRQEERNEEAHLREMEKKRIEADARDLERRRNRGEDVTKEEIALQKRRLALQEQGSKEYTETLHALEDMEDAHHKTMADKRKAAATEAAKKAEENRKKRIEEEKKANDQILQYAIALEDARIAAIQDAGERERAEVMAQYERRIEEIKKQKPLTEEAEKQQTDLIAALIAERNRRIIELEKNEAQARIALRLEAMATLNGLQKESMQQELDLLAIDHEQRLAGINEQYKEEEDLRVMLVAALEQSTARERQRIQREWGEQMLKEEEERQILAIETASQYAKRTERTERQKQIAILETKLEFAEKYLNAMIASGAAENSLEVLQAKKTVQNIREQLGDAIRENDGQGFDFFEFIGLGDLDGRQQEGVKAAGRKIAESISQITDFIVSQYDRQIAKRKEAIEQADDDINELEKRLEKEKELQAQGLANNVAIIEADLQTKKMARDEEIRQEEELRKKKEAIQRAQMAADTAMQFVNLTTASTSIFKALAGIPFVGIPLAIATIGTMFGAFITTKVRAAQAISSESYGEGGWIDGKPHSQGGKKYYSATGDVRELEKDEFVVKKKVAKKHGKFLEALNSETLSASDAALREMLEDLGIHFAQESIGNGLNEAKELERIRRGVTVNIYGKPVHHSGDSSGTQKIVEAIKKYSIGTKITKHGWYNTQSKNNSFSSYLRRNGM